MTVLTNSERKVLTGLLDECNASAASAFSKVGGIEIGAKPSRISLWPAISDGRDTYPNQEGVMLITPAIGELTAKSFLWITNADCRHIYQIAPGAIQENTSMHDAFLLELDNILCASFLTVLANKLAIQVYGDVPFLQHLRETNSVSVINSYNPLPGSGILMNTNFFDKRKPDFAPAFTWKFSLNFLDAVRAFSSTATLDKPITP